MTKPRYAGPDHPRSDVPQKMVDTPDVSSALFDFAPDTEPVEELASPVTYASSPSAPIEPRRSVAWDDIGNHDGPFIVPVDEAQVFAIDRHSPNPRTTREVERIKTNRKFGLAGRVNRTAEQDDMAHQAAQAGHGDKERRRIADGMSPANARALRIVEAINRGEDPTYLELSSKGTQAELASVVPTSEVRDLSTPYVLPKATSEALQVTEPSTEQRKILRRDRQRFIKDTKGFYGLTNKEINKIKTFDNVGDDPVAILTFMDTVYANHHNRQAMETRMAVGEAGPTKHIPPENLRDMVLRYDEYAMDAIVRIEYTDFINSAIDDKSDYSVSFQDAFPVDDWMRDYPDNRAAFMSLADFIATKQFAEGGPEDNITKRARTKKPSNAHEEITWIMEKLGDKDLVDVKGICDAYKADQTSRFEYWKKILGITRQHLFTRDISDTALLHLNMLAPARRIDTE